MGNRGRWISAGLIALAIVARVAAVLVLQSHTVERSTYEHGEIAANLLAGKGFSVRFLGADGPTSQQAPLYPFVVAGAYALGGVGTPRSLLVLELGQAALGGVLAAVVMAIARTVLPDRPKTAWLAGGLVAIHPTLVYAATHVQVVSIAVVLLAGAFLGAYRAGAFGRWQDALLAGFLLGLTALTDPILALAAPGIAWAIISEKRGLAPSPIARRKGDWLRPRCLSPFSPPAPAPDQEKRGLAPSAVARRKGDWLRPRCLSPFSPPAPALAPGQEKRGLAPSAMPVPLFSGRALGLVALTAVTAALTVAPWVVRNYRVHGELVWIKSSFGYAFWQGNCALSEGTDKVVRDSVDRRLAASGPGLKDWNTALWAARHDAGYLDDIALTADDYREFARVSEPERSRRLARRAIADIQADPGRYVQLCLRRLRYFVIWDDTNPKTRSPIYRASHLGLTLLALAGWLAMGAGERRKWSPTAIATALIALFHTLTIVSARFHLPIEPFLALWAAGGLGRLGEKRGTGSVFGACPPFLRSRSPCSPANQLPLRLPVRGSLVIESSSDRTSRA